MLYQTEVRLKFCELALFDFKLHGVVTRVVGFEPPRVDVIHDRFRLHTQ